MKCGVLDWVGGGKEWGPGLWYVAPFKSLAVCHLLTLRAGSFTLWCFAIYLLAHSLTSFVRFCSTTRNIWMIFTFEDFRRGRLNLYSFHFVPLHSLAVSLFHHFPIMPTAHGQQTLPRYLA